MVRIELEREGLANRIPSGAIITGGGAETVGVIDSAKRMLVSACKNWNSKRSWRTY